MGVLIVEGVRLELFLNVGLVVLEKPELRCLCPNPLSLVNPLLIIPCLKFKLPEVEFILLLVPNTPLKAGTVLLL